jgi:drug/metabolite transporter (DMT)-like permease
MVGEMPSRWVCAGASLAAAGLACVFVDVASDVKATSVAGVILACVSAAGTAGAGVILKRLQDKKDALQAIALLPSAMCFQRWRWQLSGPLRVGERKLLFSGFMWALLPVFASVAELLILGREQMSLSLFTTVIAGLLILAGTVVCELEPESESGDPAPKIAPSIPHAVSD